VRTIPIGKPIANTSAYVVDPGLQLLPVGVPGELLVGGDGVARGYLNHAELTAERFVPDIFSGRPGARLYRTGDVVRRLSDGNLEFVGRHDGQVKIRGFRVEVGEVEAVLAAHPAIAAVAVCVEPGRDGERRLVAHLVPRQGEAPGAAQLRAYLSHGLPHFMIPAAFVMHTALPLTPNGKVDRARLHRAAEQLDEPAAAQRQWSDKLELHLAKLWQELLDLDNVNAEDNFFDLGGHSLLAARLIDEVERRFGRRLPLDVLWYGDGTIPDMARLLRAQGSEADWPMVVPLKTAGARPVLYCVHTMGGNLFHYDSLAHALGPDQPVSGLSARGVYKGEPRRTVEGIAADCIEAMLAQERSGPWCLAGFSSGGPVAFEIGRQLVARGERVGIVALIDSFAPGRSVISRSRDWARSMKRARWREVQERSYHLMLRTLGLSRLRRTRTIGEAQRWAH